MKTKNNQPPLSGHINTNGRTLRDAVFAIVAGIVVAIVIVYGLSVKTNEITSLGNYTLDPEEPSDALMSPVTGNSGTMCYGKDANSLECLIKPTNNSCLVGSGELCDADLKMARIAWTYFENNYNPETGLVNAVNNFPSTTMWDTGSALAATVAAFDFGFIEKKEFDDRITAMIGSLARMELFNDEAPNKVYNTKTLKMLTMQINQPI